MKRNPRGGKPPGENVLGITRHLEENAEATRVEIGRALGRDISASITRMNRTLLNQPKRIYIIRWVYEDDDARLYPRPVYALGDLPDAKKPKASRTVNQQRYTDRERNRANSVWQWATPVHRRQEQTT